MAQYFLVISSEENVLIRIVKVSSQPIFIKENNRKKETNWEQFKKYIKRSALLCCTIATWNLLQNVLDLLLKAHIQHLIGLVQHRKANVGQQQAALVDQIGHAARSAFVGRENECIFGVFGVWERVGSGWNRIYNEFWFVLPITTSTPLRNALSCCP